MIGAEESSALGALTVDDGAADARHERRGGEDVVDSHPLVVVPPLRRVVDAGRAAPRGVDLPVGRRVQVPIDVGEAADIEEGCETRLLVGGETWLALVVGVQCGLAVRIPKPVGVGANVVPACGDVEVAEPHERLGGGRPVRAEEGVALRVPRAALGKRGLSDTIVRRVSPEQLKIGERAADHPTLHGVLPGRPSVGERVAQGRRVWLRAVAPDEQRRAGVLGVGKRVVRAVVVRAKKARNHIRLTGLRSGRLGNLGAAPRLSVVLLAAGRARRRHAHLGDENQVRCVCCQKLCNRRLVLFNAVEQAVGIPSAECARLWEWLRQRGGGGGHVFLLARALGPAAAAAGGLEEARDRHRRASKAIGVFVH